MSLVHILYHVRLLPGGDEGVVFIGLFSTSEDAADARRARMHMPGFRDHPDGFEVVVCEIDKDYWPKGVVEWLE